MPLTSRRHLLRGAAAAATVAAVPAVLAAPAPAVAAATVSPLHHLLRRATYGPTPASLAEAATLGVGGWLDRQLNPSAIADPVADALLARLPLAQASVAGVRAAVTAGTLKRYGWEAMYQLGVATVGRAAWSNRQLLEAVVEFWSNHLCVTNPFDEGWDNRPDYDRAVIRRYALGRYADLLKASATHPAMLSYLDNRHSTKYKPNENYARELLELHTVGTIHTEADVVQAARLLTGLTVDWKTGAFQYDAATHATGAVKILGYRHANATAAGGRAAALGLLDYLARHPATARRIAEKLCVRFVSDTPPPALVDRLAALYLARDTAIAPVLRALFTSAEFAASAGAKVRGPYEDMIATVRTLGLGLDAAGVEGVRALYWMAESVGQAPLAWGQPDGYPDTAAAWAAPAGLLGRWNNHLNLAAGWWPEELVRPAASLTAALLPTVPATYGELVDTLTDRLVGVRFADSHRAALAGFFGKQPASTLRTTDGAANGALPYLVALILDSPYFAER
ncbi:hypothetical protein GCM10010124_04730 [Pilimelia terevasa]|uniref:DUF1800 domain-containing protein n=1 Tax=Pilimelia terevasa TaxID=53372 RepID=A0A8J3BEA1_9ACTN|nr:DUF1800 domain-containing protein [Pilimelia terevasa]GGK15199.1 hypothetical protein GCM10010124_04730 [Pilimelia terevasa]